MYKCKIQLLGLNTWIMNLFECICLNPTWHCTVGEIGPWHYLNSFKGCKRFKWCSDGLYDCFYGCQEGQSIFPESFIFLRVLICACGEGEIVAVMACLSLLPPCLTPGSPGFSSLIMSLQIPWTVLLAAWMVQAYSKKISFSSEFMFVFAEKEKCHSQVSLCPGPSS